MKKIILAFIFASLLSFVEALPQDVLYKSYNWDTPQWVNYESDDAKTILKKKEIVEYVFTDQSEEYYIFHVIEYLNSDDEIELNNKKYIPFNVASEIVTAKARVIKKNNEVIELDESKILEAYDEESGGKYKYFALEGLELGNIVEVFYVLKRYPNLSGSYLYIQDEYQILDYSFQLVSPTHLEFAFHLSHDTTNIKLDTIAGKKHYHFEIKSVEKLEREDKAPYNDLRKRITYKLDKNYSRGTKNISSYETGSKNIYNNIYTIEKADLKALQKFSKGFNLSSEATPDEKIRIIEDFTKTNITVMEESDARFENLPFAIANKTATSYSITKIFANLFKLHNIEHQIVVTSDRTKLPFDQDFESFHNLSTYLIYFPGSDIFLCPDKFEYRGGLIPAKYTDNYGLFIQEISLGEFKSGVGQVKYIPLASYKTSYHNHEITARLEDDFSTVHLDFLNLSNGYYAAYLQSVLDLVGEDIYDEIGKNYLAGQLKNLDIEQWSFENIGATNVEKEPLLLSCKATVNSLIDFAGDNYLFKVGELIGPQAELYSKTERKLPIHDSYKREFNREIKVIIPEGYKVQNLDDLKIFAEYKNNEKQILLFDSDYKLVGQEIQISIVEYYDQVYFESSEYHEYRKVVNSASDFNKVILIIGKE